MQNAMTPAADNPGVVALPPVLYGIAFLVVLVLRPLWPMPMFPVAYLWTGLAFAMIGIGIAIWGRRTMRAAGTNINPALPALAIVQAGPFRYSRNPLYFALTLLFLGLTLAFNTWWGIVVLVPLIVVMHVGVVLREERYLDQKFGETYRQYRSRVRRYL